MNVATSSWPSTATVGWPSPPQALMPGRVQGWSRGTQATANDAERLLAQAVGWWDAAWYRDGDRFLRNRGVAGELLDMRLGSSLAANSNDPLYLAPEATGYCYLPNVVGNYLSVPDENALDITGDLDVRAWIAPDRWQWTPGDPEYGLVSKWNSASGATQRGYLFVLRPDGYLRLAISTDGTANSTSQSTVAMATNAVGQWVRATFRASDGRVQFFTSPDGSTWTQLGADVSNASRSIYSNTAQVQIGVFNGSVNVPLLGRVYRAQILNGIDGTTVLDVDCDALTSGSATSFTATTGQTVTINKSTSGRKTKVVPAAGRGGTRQFLLGTDDYFEIPAENVWQHQLLNFGQGDSFTVLFVGRQWNTPGSSNPWIAKGVDSGVGWRIIPNGTALSTRATISDGTNQINRVSGTITAGTLSVLLMTVDRAAGAWTYLVNNAQSDTSSSRAVASVASQNLLRIGRREAANYQDFEFTSAAIFRRALTAAEITTLTNYYTNRGF